MNFDFPFILLSATLLSGIIALTDKLYTYYRYGKFKTDPTDDPIVVEYSKSFFPILLLVFIVRSFLYEPYRVPTSSLAPTVLPGDFILSNKYNYGIKLPVWNYQLFKIGKPQRGDIAIFRSPVDQSTWLVKRIVGIPGDKISYHNKKFTINGTALDYKFIKKEMYTDETNRTYPMDVIEEDLLGVKHLIFNISHDQRAIDNFTDITVPENHYFMIGDNRDNSDDSRYWGFVPVQNIEGQALFVLFNWSVHSWSDISFQRFHQKFYLT